MSWNRDYLLRQIETAARALALAIFGRDWEGVLLVDREGRVTESGLLYRRLEALLRGRKIDEAENVLFEEIEREPSREHLRAALLFYHELECRGDEALRRDGFSLAEVRDGLRALGRLYPGEPAFSALFGADGET